MTTPVPPENGDTVALRGLVTTVYLKAGEVANVIWSPFYTVYLDRGYAEIYVGPQVPTPVYRSFSDTAVADLVGSSTAKTRLALEVLIGQLGGGGGGLDEADVAALVNVSESALRVALDAHYAPVSPVISAPVYNPDGTLAQITENGVTTVFTYNAAGNVATAKRGTDATQTYSYNSDGTFAGVA